MDLPHLHEMGGYIGVAAGIAQLIGYAIYNLHIRRSETSANATSWAIWTFGSLINFVLYRDLSHDWAKEVLPFLCSIGCIGTFVHIWKKNGFGNVDRFDLWILGIDCAIVVYWIITSADEANLIYQVGTVISFIPMIRGLLKHEDHEHPVGWVVWTVAYQLMMVAVMYRWEKWQDLVYPGVCFVLHAAVAVIACLTPSVRKSG